MLNRIVLIACVLTIALAPDVEACRHRRRRIAACPPPAAYARPVAPTAPAYYQPAPMPQAIPMTVPVPQAAIQLQPAPVVAQPPTVGGEAASFTAWLNNVRAGYGLPAVGYDPGMEAVSHQNNTLQATRGLGHHFLGHARRQNSAAGMGFPGVETAWMNSSGHRAALLDPNIRAIGIAYSAGYWTYSAN